MKGLQLLFIIFISTIAFSCTNSSIDRVKYKGDLRRIMRKGQLNVLTLNTSTSYFIYKDEPMGYDYDMVNDFCRHHGLKLNIIVAENSVRLLDMLLKGKGDLAAFSLPIRNDLKNKIIYCGLERVSHQVLVQRNNRGDTILKDVSQLIGKDVYVKYDTKFHQRLENLNNEIGGGINIKNVEIDTISSEELIRMVSAGEIKYTIADEYVAKLNRTYYSNINTSLDISFDQRSSWGVRKNSPQLAKALNEWFDDKKNKPVYATITKKYFEISKRGFDQNLELAKNLPKGALSIYDHLFIKHAENTKYNWHLLAAISYQESRFINNLTSWAGASGIMGIMPKIAVSLGISEDERMDPDKSIYAAVKLLDKIDKIFKDIDDPNERIKFTLASYNGGVGHIVDARKLARKYGYNPNVWEGNVKEAVILKRYPEYYEDSICKNGYFRGTETLNYVHDVVLNTEKFKKITSAK